jgi:UDP-N-acetylmuramate: L-alanyl-gamma-D-glutamyl-meso-diaminopimelate ligase
VDADGVIVSQIARLELLKPEERLNPEQLMQDLKGAGKNAAYLPDVDTIVGHAGKHVQPGDVVCVFSNGGFGGIHTKLLDRFARR